MSWKTITAAALACTLLPGVASNAAADWREHHERGWRGDIRTFHERDFGRWRAGRWHHGYYNGRLGWWWIVGGVYYWYPRAVYPYPDPFVPPVFIEQPPAVAAVPQPAPPAPPPQSQPQGAAGTWYYCDAARSYYPYVGDCPGGWRAVPAVPNAPPR